LKKPRTRNKAPWRGQKMGLDGRITGKTGLLGLLGYPVEHSCSPLLHNTLSSIMGIDVVYVPLPTVPGKLGDVVKALKSCGFIGVNVTIPFKGDILRYVDECSDDVKLMGSANTLTFRDNRIIASNTDAAGFVLSFRRQAGCDFYGKKVVVLGAGGTSRALSMKIAAEGASEIRIVNRTPEKARSIAERINKHFGTMRTSVEAVDYVRAEEEKIFEKCDILINTTPAGMYPRIDECPLNPGIKLRKDQVIYDVIYNPAVTKLMRRGMECGCKTLNGSGMLFYQGVLSFETWMNVSIPREILDKVYADFNNYLNRSL